MREIKWSQWDETHGMLRCGHSDYSTLMKWMRELGKDAEECRKRNGDAPHAVYGRKIYDEDDKLVEVRFYCDLYPTDEQLDEIVRNNPHNEFFVAHRKGGAI